jgi:hypothetical protein
MPAETQPHQYEQGDLTSPMHTDSRCTVCGEPKGSDLHYDGEDEILVCLDSYQGNCRGPVEYRPSMSPTGIPYPRCAAHFDARWKTQRRIVRSYGGSMTYGNY